MDTSPLSPDARLLKVAIRFFVIYAVLQTVVWVLTFRHYMDWTMLGTARLVGAMANLTGVPATVTGNQVALATRILRIDPDCTAIRLMIIYSSLVAAYPLSAKRRFLGVLAGIPTIFVANLLRLWAVSQLSAPLGDEAFTFVHDYLFQVAMVAVVIVMWAVHLSSARRHAG